MADLAKIVDDLSKLTVLEAAELSKLLEEKWGVSAAAPVAVAAAGGGCRCRCSGRREDRIRRRPHRGRRPEDQRHQGSPRHHRPWPQGSQGPGRGGSEAGQGRRFQGRRREVQGPAGSSRRQGRTEVSVAVSADGSRRPPRPAAGRPRYGHVFENLFPEGRKRPSGNGFSPVLDCRPRSVAAVDDYARRVRRRPPRAEAARSDDGPDPDFQWPQTRTQVLREDPGSCGDAEPHRGSEGILRPVPDGGRARRRPSGRGTAGRFQVGIPDLRFFRHVDAGIRQVRVRAAEVRRRRMPSARPDLRGAAQGDAAPDRVRYRRGYRRQVRSRTSRSRTSTWATCRS